MVTYLNLPDHTAEAMERRMSVLEIMLVLIMMMMTCDQMVTSSPGTITHHIPDTRQTIIVTNYLLMALKHMFNQLEETVTMA